MTKDNMTILNEAIKVYEDDIKKVETHIYNIETRYLEDTAAYGNLVKGWDGYMDSKGTKSSAFRRHRISEKHRIFSSSSATSDLVMNQPDSEGKGSKSRSVGIRKSIKGYKRK